MSTENEKLLAAATLKLDALKRAACIDPADFDSRPSPTQETVLRDTDSLHIYVVAGNQSGKTAMGARIVAWKFENNHPYWKRPKGWGKEPLLIIVAGRLTSHLEEIWRSKLEPLLTPGSFKIKRSAGVLQEVTSFSNNNKILFTSHDKAKDAKEKIQSFVAHHFWLDEMPSHSGYVEEAHRRVDARQGQFFATMTPKSRNEDIRHMVDNADGSVATKYRMGKLDNPIYHGREDVEWAKIAHLPKKVQNNIMFGDWLDGDERVFWFDRDLHQRVLPPNYTAMWPHVLSVDPAASGTVGLIVMAKEPKSTNWWVVRADYIAGTAPSLLVEQVETISKLYNVVRKIYDPHETWFAKEAQMKGATYMGVYNKTGRKKDLITAVQQALEDGWLMHCPGLNDLVIEYSTAEWAENKDDKIKNSTAYHLLDALQYAIDCLPKIEEIDPSLPYDAKLMEAFRATEKLEASLRKTSNPRVRKRLRAGFVNKKKKRQWMF